MQITFTSLITLNNINFTRLQFDRTSWSLNLYLFTPHISSSLPFSLAFTHIYTHLHIQLIDTHIHTLMDNDVHIHSRQFVLVNCATLGLSAKIHEWKLERTKMIIMIINNRPCVATLLSFTFASSMLFRCLRLYARVACECVICARVSLRLNILFVKINSLTLVESQRSFRRKFLK